jgi:ORF6N domain-containing protein
VSRTINQQELAEVIGTGFVSRDSTGLKGKGLTLESYFQSPVNPQPSMRVDPCQRLSMGGNRRHAVGHGVIPVDRITRSILLIRGQKVMLDEALAALYEVEVKVLNQAVRRNAKRFPADFMFQLTAEETVILRSQFVTLKTGSGRHRKYLPYAFTEQGVAMLSSVLRSARAVRVNIQEPLT